MGALGSFRKRIRRDRQREEDRRRRAIHPQQTFWNGEPTPCMRVEVEVSAVPEDWWCEGMEGTVRKAIEVVYDAEGRSFFLDDEGGAGWLKVTEGLGGPGYAHRSLPDHCEVISMGIPCMGGCGEVIYVPFDSTTPAQGKTPIIMCTKCSDREADAEARADKSRGSENYAT